MSSSYEPHPDFVSIVTNPIVASSTCHSITHTHVLFSAILRACDQIQIIVTYLNDWIHLGCVRGADVAQYRPFSAFSALKVGLVSQPHKEITIDVVS
jgi:hypothetical protein